MLVLTRKTSDWIRLRDTVSGRVMRVVVVDIGHGKVRLGFECDKSIEILREELLPPERGEGERSES